MATSGPGKKVDVDGNTKFIQVVPTITTGYITADALGAGMTFTNAARAVGVGVTLQTLLLFDKTLNNSEMEVHWWSALPTISDSVVFNPSDAQGLTWLGMVEIKVGHYRNFLNNSVCMVPRIGLALKPAVADANLYANLVIRSTASHTAGDLALTGEFYQD